MLLHVQVTVVSTVREQVLAPFAGSASAYLRRHVAALARALRHSWPARQGPTPRSWPARQGPTPRSWPARQGPSPRPSAPVAGPLSEVSQLTCRLVALDTSLLRTAAPDLLLSALSLLEEPAGLVRAPLGEEVCDEVWERLLREGAVTAEGCQVYRSEKAASCDVWFFIEKYQELNETERMRFMNATVQHISCHANHSLQQVSWHPNIYLF